MLRVETLNALREGGLRGGRMYDGEYRASRCGRMLTIGDGFLAIAPNNVVVTTLKDLRETAQGAGLLCHVLPDSSREAVEKALTDAPSLGIKRALRWVLGQ